MTHSQARGGVSRTPGTECIFRHHAALLHAHTSTPHDTQLYSCTEALHTLQRTFMSETTAAPNPGTSGSSGLSCTRAVPDTAKLVTCSGRGRGRGSGVWQHRCVWQQQPASVGERACMSASL